MFRHQPRGQNKARAERNPPHEHAGQLTLGLSDNAAPERRTNPAPIAPRARASDVETSREAAKRAAGIANAHYALIRKALEQADGNIYELGSRCGLTHVQVARRLPEMHGLNQAEPTSERREGCRVWRLIR